MAYHGCIALHSGNFDNASMPMQLWRLQLSVNTQHFHELRHFACTFIDIHMTDITKRICLYRTFTGDISITYATFSPKPITGTAPQHRIGNNYRLITAHYRHLYGFHYKGCLPLPAIYRQEWSIYRRLRPVMKNYRHAADNVVMKYCTSNPYASPTNGGNEKKNRQTGRVVIKKLSKARLNQ